VSPWMHAFFHFIPCGPGPLRARDARDRPSPGQFISLIELDARAHTLSCLHNLGHRIEQPGKRKTSRDIRKSVIGTGRAGFSERSCRRDIALAP
jgi:hypothetical protein